MGKTVPQGGEKSNDLLLLHMEIKAIRDRVMHDLDAALAKVASAIPEQELPCTREMNGWGKARWRQFLETGR